MKIYWLILWTVLTVLFVLWNNLSDGVSVELNNSASVQSGVSENISQTKRNWQITHLGFSEESYVQNVVNYAYKLWGMDFVLMLECENGSYRLDATSDRGHSRGLCMVNNRWHKDVPWNYTTSWVVAVEYCYQKWKGWTKFYGPQRKIKGQTCANYVKNRFRFNW